MSDLYKEHLVKKEPTAADTAKKFGSILLIVLCAAAGLFIHPLMLIAAIVLGVLAAVFIFPNTDLEYEYLLVNHSLDIDKVMAKSRRKKIKSFDLGTADIIAPLNSHRMDYYNANSSLKIQDYSSGNPEHKRYAFVIRENGTTSKVIIEPDDAMIQMLRQSLPGKCFTD